MDTVYWAALVLGAGLLLLSVAGDIVGDDADAGTDANSADTGHGVGALRIFTFRNLTYVLMGSGVAGVMLGWAGAGRSPGLTAAIAVTTGLLCAATRTLVCHALRKATAGGTPGDPSIVGLVGDVVLPLTNGKGKILVRRAGREIELPARPLDDAPRDSERWTSVLVVEVKDGIAYVAPYRDLLEE